MYNLMNEGYYDLVVGSKVLGEDRTDNKRKLISKVYRAYTRRLLRIDISDPMSGLVVAKKSLMKQIRPTNEFKFLLQLLLLTKNVAEVPIVFEKRKMGVSKANALIGFNILFNMFKLKTSSARRKLE